MNARIKCGTYLNELIVGILRTVLYIRKQNYICFTPNSSCVSMEHRCSIPSRKFV